MLFPTFTFAVFFAVVLPVSWALRRWSVPWKAFLVAASYVFYAAWDTRFISLLALLTATSYASAVVVDKFGGLGDKRKSKSDSKSGSKSDIKRNSKIAKIALVLGVSCALGVLAFFKYYNFFTDSLQQHIGISSPVLNIVLPVGVSFFTFQAISYMVDASRGDVEVASLLDVALYLSFFPQLVAGPIVRASEFLPQTNRKSPYLERADVSRAVHLIGAGLFKKVVIVDILERGIVKDVFADPASYSTIDVLAGIYGYAVQIYADFSGYTDMAIGVALLIGFQFPQNFNRPYTAVSVRDFWRRWHMTLSRWLRDYLYIPLGGSRRGKARTYLNLLATMVLGGLWHGAAGVFLVWGLYHGLGLLIERVSIERVSKDVTAHAQSQSAQSGDVNSQSNSESGGECCSEPSNRSRVLTSAAQKFVVFHIVCVGWVLFNSENLAKAGSMLVQLVRGWNHPTILVTPVVVSVIASMILLQYLPKTATARLTQAMSSVPLPVVAVGFALWLTVIVALGSEGVSDYIYFQF